MHAVVIESLEEYLSGVLAPAARGAIEAHLANCGTCREEIQGMREVSQWLGALRPEEAPAPAPGFYASVMRQVSERRAAPGFSSLFALDMVFGRRLVFASLLTLAVLGGYLVTHEAGYQIGPSPEAILAQQNAPAFETARAEDNMLVTLSAYGH